MEGGKLKHPVAPVACSTMPRDICRLHHGSATAARTVEAMLPMISSCRQEGAAPTREWVRSPRHARPSFCWRPLTFLSELSGPQISTLIRSS